MILMEVSGVYTSSKSAYPQVVLKEKAGNTYLPIVIGRFEAAAISMAQNNKKPIRPISYDLACTIFNWINARVEKVEITDLHEGTYYAEIHLHTDDGTPIVFDSRPSDAIALALRVGAPIYAAAAVLKEAGYVRPDELSQPPLTSSSDRAQSPEKRQEQMDSPRFESSLGRLELLKKRLQQAVAEEVYEEAARLRDEISRLENNGEG